MGTSDELITAETIGSLVSARAAELGSISDAAKVWKVSVQMVHMVINGRRRPSDSMLADMNLEKVRPDVCYRRKA